MNEALPAPPRTAQAVIATYLLSICLANGQSTEEVGGIDRLKQLTMADLMNVEVATVTTASKLSEKATEAPATVIVIDKNDIELRGYATLRDVLRDLPGMETIEFYFSEFGTLVPVRGIAGNNKIIVLVDGLRVNPPGGENFPFRSDISVRNAEQIEIIYGPGSTLYGQDAISAVINIKTKRSVSGHGGEAGVAGGTDGTKETWARLSSAFGREGQGTFTASLDYRESELTPVDREYPDWFRDYAAVARSAEPPGLGLDPAREDLGLNGLVRLDYRESSVQLWYRRSERSSSEGFTPVLGYLDEAQWGDSSLVIEGRNTFTFRDNLHLDSSVAYNRYEIDPDSRYIFTVPAPGGGSQWFFDDYKYGLGTGVTLEETLRYAVNDELSLLGGATAGTFDIIPKSTIPGRADTGGDIIEQAGSFAYIDPDTGATNLIPRAVRERYQTYAAYFEGGWQFLPDVKLIAGARLTKDTRFDDLPFTPRAALVYTVTKEVTAKYIFTRAYVAPAPYFSYATYDNGAFLADSNSDIKPESAESHEINLAYARKNLTAGISGYYGTQRDLILVADQAAPQNLLDQVTLPDGSSRTLVQSANGGQSRNYGVDVYGRAKWGPVSTWASYSFVDFEASNNGNTMSLPGISQHNGRLGLTLAVLDNLFLTPSLVIRSTPENVSPGALSDELQTPYEINLHALYKATKRVDVFTTLRNITDHHYALGGITGSAVPQETFNGIAGVQVNF